MGFGKVRLIQAKVLKLSRWSLGMFSGVDISGLVLVMIVFGEFIHGFAAIGRIFLCVMC